MYSTKNVAWGSRFLPSYLDSALLAKRDANLATRFAVKRLEIQNRSGAVCSVGFGGRLPADPVLWRAGKYVTGSPGTYTDDTTDAQNGATGDFELSTLANNDGFIVLCQIPFNVLSVIVQTAAAGGLPVWDLEYTRPGGAWVSIAANVYALPTFGTGAGAEHLAWWEMPIDWTVSEAGHATGIPTGYYGIRFRATTAPSGTAPLASQLIPGVIVESTENVADNQFAIWEYPDPADQLLPPQCDGLAIVMAGANIPNAQNKVSVLYQLRG